MSLQNVCNNIDINSCFSFSLWFQISSILNFCLRSVVLEKIAVRILTLNSFLLKTLKKFAFLYQDIDKYRHADIDKYGDF